MARKKIYPQVIVIELMVVVVAAVGVYFLVPLTGAPHAVGAFFAGVAADRALTLLLRHRNKKLLPWLPQVKITRKPAARRPAARTATRKAHH